LKRDVAVIPLNHEEELIIAADNSGSIGMRKQDDIKVSYDIVSYFNFRVAWMECAAAGADPFAVILQNFAGDGAWEMLMKGIHRGMAELDIDLEIIGSTETNFSLVQSAVGISILGRRNRKANQDFSGNWSLGKIKAAVIGKPLVGNEVLENKQAIFPLHLFEWYTRQKEVLSIVPVGSKGILYELKQIFKGREWEFSAQVDLEKTSGPATCFVVIYEKSADEFLKNYSGELFHEVEMMQY
jgi:hypothetical protein